MEMRATLGITEPKFTRDPLGTEGEMTDGPDDENPYETGETDKQPDLPPFIGDDVPFGGDRVVEAMDDEADDRHERMHGLFASEGFHSHGFLD